MRRFLSLLVMFILPLMLGVIILFSIPVQRKYAYSFVNKGGCEGRSSWIYRSIYEDTTAIDVAFLGSSHSMCAVNDEQIEAELNAAGRYKLKVHNLAYCGVGRNLDYVIARDLLQNKKVKILVLEIREAETQLGHGSFSRVATSADLFTAPLAFNRNYIPDLYSGLLFRLQYLRETATGEYVQHLSDIPASRFGFNGDSRTADPNELYNHETGRRTFDFIKNGLDAVQLQYVSNIAGLAAKHNTRLVMLYLPQYGQVYDKQKLQRIYGKHGHIIFPPERIFTDKGHWFDHMHLNRKAAKQISDYTAQELKNTLLQK